MENDGIKWLDAIGHDIEEIRQILFDLDYYRSLDEVAYIKMQGKEEDRRYMRSWCRALLKGKGLLAPVLQ